ncbi:MAG: cobalamin-binding protein [Candidatus Riflebacteria bacterium HGW-Riflebacteria-1]|jgi:methanogenic corrinoid protein MtbC1|nr:MAG: cobalamin-binding protein [Candidatus Riflebacteria bacterium HGW-Riflebacteria-1]
MQELTRKQKLFVQALMQLDTSRCRELLAGQQTSEDCSTHPEEIVVPALENIGQAWETGHISLSQVYMSSRICEKVMEKILPQDSTPQESSTRLAIGVIEDYHALGKRMVISSLRSAGYKPIDLGHGLKAEELVEKALQEKADILLISCLMLASAIHVKDVVEGLNRAGSQIPVVVGGAPFRLYPALWKETGAHAVGNNSADAVKIVRDLVGRQL